MSEIVGDEVKLLRAMDEHRGLMFFDRLEERGLVRRWPSGYEITQDGRSALSKAGLPKLPAWAKDKRLARPHDWLTAAFERLLIYAEGGDAERDGMRDTPQRASRAWAELTEGYQMEWDAKAFEAEGEGLVVMDGIPFHSLCEHHCLPFFGTVHFAYIPNDLILGFSKFARLVTVYSRRLQVQERLTKQMADAIHDKLTPEGIMVVVRAQHLCMSMRGAQSLGQTAITSEVMGTFASNHSARAEAMRLMS